MAALLIISFISFFGYLIYITAKYGILPSISDSVYYSDKEWPFLLFTFGTGIPIIFVSDYILMQIAGALMASVGLSPRFKQDKGIEDEAHVVGATGAVVVGMISMIVNYKLWFIPIPLVVFLAMDKITKIPNKTLWAEVIAFGAILTGLIIG